MNLISDRRAGLKKAAVLVWTIALVAVLTALAVAFREFNWAMYRNLDPLMLLQAVPVVFLAFVLTKRLLTRRILRWRPSHILFPPREDASPAQGSLIVRAMQIRVVGLVVTALLLACLPSIAALEELIFRDGTTGWGDAALRSLLFGIAHLATDLPLGAALSVGLVGMWFSHWYRLGGINASIEAHFSYILIITALAALSVIHRHLRR